MIELFSADTPNGKKISIMLEEIGFDYKVTKVDLSKDEQFNPEFIKISPLSKIPVIIDHKNNDKIFEFRNNSKELNVLFQEVFKTKTLDSDMRDMLEQFVQGYQRIKKLSKLIMDNVAYSDFNIIPSFNILTERINCNYERLVN